MESSRHLSPLARLQAAFVAGLVIALVAALFTIGTARAASILLTAELTAEEEVPEPGPEGATGFASVTIDDETNEVCFELTIDGLEEDDFVTAAHIHVGEAGVAGDVVVPFFNEPPDGDMTGCVEADAEVVAAILANPSGYYVNIHSDMYPPGAVRGQLVLDAAPAEPNCVVEVDPSMVAVGQDFVVSGNFGGAEIYLVRGDAPVAEDATPDATVPQDQDSFAVTFTAEAGDEGNWTVWGFIPASECGDSAQLTIVAGVPDAAARPSTTPIPAAVAALILIVAIPTLLRSVVRS